MNTLAEFDADAIDAAVAALRTALAAARAHAAGTLLADEIAGLSKARLIVTADCMRVRVALFAPNSEGEVMRVFALEAQQEVMQ